MSLVPPKLLSLCRILEEYLTGGCLVFLAAFCLTQMDGIPADFHSQLCGLLSQALVLQAGEPGVGLRPLTPLWGPLQLIYFP